VLKTKRNCDPAQLFGIYSARDETNKKKKREQPSIGGIELAREGTSRTKNRQKGNKIHHIFAQKNGVACAPGGEFLAVPENEGRKGMIPPGGIADHIEQITLMPRKNWMKGGAKRKQHVNKMCGESPAQTTIRERPFSRREKTKRLGMPGSAFGNVPSSSVKT